MAPLKYHTVLLLIGIATYFYGYFCLYSGLLNLHQTFLFGVLIRLLVCSEKIRLNKVNHLKPIVYQSKSRPMLSNTNLIDWLTPRTHACSTMPSVTHPTVKTPTTSTCTATPPSGVNKITTHSSNLIAHRILYCANLFFLLVHP